MEIIGELSINSEYVCYDSTNDEIQFSINRGEIDLDKLIIAIETETEIKNLNLKKMNQMTIYLLLFLGAIQLFLQKMAEEHILELVLTKRLLELRLFR